MPRTTDRKKLGILLFIFLSITSLIFVASCYPSQKNKTVSTDKPIVISATSQNITPSITSQKTVCEKRTVTPTVEFPPTYSFTPVYTLAPVELQKTLTFMIYQNGGCKLPCWWGITPGQTKYEDMIRVLSPLVKKFDNIEYDTATGKVVLTMPHFIEDENAYEGGFSFNAFDGIVQGVFVDQDFAKRYTLASLLSNYGEPEEIFLATDGGPSPDNTVPFSLIISYPTKGIFAHYESSSGGKLSGNYIIICPQNILPNLSLWPSGLPQRGEEEKLDVMRYSGFDNYKKIEMASDLNNTKFYYVFSQRNGTQCIISKAEKWDETVETFVPYFPTDTITPTPVNPYLETVNPNSNIETVIPTP